MIPQVDGASTLGVGKPTNPFFPLRSRIFFRHNIQLWITQ